MTNYDFTNCLSPLDFELLSKDLLEAELGIQLENFREGQDKGIDLRYAPARYASNSTFNSTALGSLVKVPPLIVQCKRYTSFSKLKSDLKAKEFPKIAKLNPTRYILTTSASLSPQQADEIKSILTPFVKTTADIYSRERLNSILSKYEEIERRHIKLWASSTNILNTFINAGTHVVSQEEIERTIAASKIYVKNASFDEALAILKQHRVCIISGLPGIGKTTLARMLLLYYFNRNYDVIKIESNISEARAVGYHKKPRFYFYDDFLGQTGQADKLGKNEDQKLLDFMTSIQDSKDSVFILTTREYILNQAKLHYEKLDREKFDYRTCIIDLAKYSRRIRAQVLYNHLHFSDLPRTHLADMVTQRGYVKIVDHANYNPRLIQYLTDTKWIGDTHSADYLDLFIRKLDNPVEIWDHAFRNQVSDRARHLLFVLTTMPAEAILSDIEKAFLAFHKSICETFRMSLSTMDFKYAIKELDGAFISLRNVQTSVLIRFQNPSIRDFMQNLLLDGELLSELIASLVFFEQAQWFMKVLGAEEPPVPTVQLMRYSARIVETLRNLIDTESCAFWVEGTSSWQQIRAHETNPAGRLGFVATAAKRHKQENDAWVFAKISNLSYKVEIGEVSPAYCIELIKTLKELYFLDSDPGRSLVSTLKSRVVPNPETMEDFEVIADLISIVPPSFAKSELDTLRESYGEFIDWYPNDCDISSPQDLREEAVRVGYVGNVLQVYTEAAQNTLKETAEEIEEQESRRDHDDDERMTYGASNECLDSELDSMFRTLDYS